MVFLENAFVVCSYVFVVLPLHLILSYRITNKWIRWKPQEFSFPCSNNGWNRQQPLQDIYCKERNKIKEQDDEECNQDMWSRKKETFFHQNIHFAVIETINKVLC